MTALPGKPAANSVQSGHDQLMAVSPGQRLQKARKERNLEIPAVADKLNLSPGVVRALEADDYRMLPNATFVKGYLRSYARVLEISSDDLVRAYEAITGCNQPVKVEPIAAPLIRDGRSGVRNLIVALAVLVLVAMSVWFFWGRGDAGADVQSQAAAEESVAAPLVRPAVNPPVVITRPDVIETEAAAIDAAARINEPVAEAEEPASPEPAIASADTVMPPTPVAPEAVTQDVLPTETAIAAGGASGLINLRFQGECWVELRDGRGDLVFSSLKRAGEEVSLRALTPINVKLGNGDVVDVRFNNQPVAFSTRPERKVVRLTLGE